MSKYILSFFSSLAASLTAIFLCFFVLPIMALITFAFFTISNDTITNGNFDFSAITINLAEPIADVCETQNPIAIYINGATPLTTHSICEKIKSASKDEQNKILFLYGSFDSSITPPSFAQISEIRNALTDYIKSGKQVFAYLENPSVRDYFLASCSTKIYLNPISDFQLKGLGGNAIFFGNALKKYGVKPTVVKVGKRKSFGEMFTSDKMSEDVRKNYQELLGSIWTTILTKISASRKIPLESLKQIADEKAIISAEDAVSLKLVDKLMYRDEVVDLMKIVVGAKKSNFKQTPIRNYFEKETESEQRIVLVYMNGDIVDNDTTLTTISPTVYRDIIRKARDDKNVSAMVVRIDSGGGDAYAAEQIRRELELFAKNKPLIFSIGATAASGAYWLATSANEIVADETSITGSIGVFSLMFSVEKLANNYGITFEPIKTTPMSDFGTITREPSELEIARLQNLTDKIYKRFINLVSQSRKIPLERVEEFADGGIFSGKDAKQMKLIDKIGGVQFAISRAKELAKIPNAKIDELPKRDPFSDLMQSVSPLSDGEFAKIKLLKPLFEISSKTKYIKNGVYTRTPFDFKIK